MTVKELLIDELDKMSEIELKKTLRLLQVFGLANHKSSNIKNYPLRGLPVEYIDLMELLATQPHPRIIRLHPSFPVLK